MPGRVRVKLTVTHDDCSDEGGEKQCGQRQRLRSQDAPPRSTTHGLTTASRHRFSQTFAAAPTTTAPRSRTDSVSALSPTLVPSLINQGCSEIDRGAPRPRRAAGLQKTASGAAGMPPVVREPNSHIARGTGAGTALQTIGHWRRRSDGLPRTAFFPSGRSTSRPVSSCRIDAMGPCTAAPSPMADERRGRRF